MITQPVSSSTLQSVGYDKDTDTMEIAFRNGGKYSYPDTHPNTYRGLLKAKSKGSYFHNIIRQKTDYEKIAEELNPYQQRVINRILSPSQSGLVVAHGTGTGKTRTSIEAYKQLNLPTNVVVPAALKANYAKELLRWAGKLPDNLKIDSQQAVARKGLVNDPKNGLLIVDEAHRAREGSGALIEALRKSEAQKRLLLTATPVFNHPKDLATLVNLAANNRLLPTTKEDFDQKFVNYKEISPNLLHRFLGVAPGIIPELKNKAELRKAFNKYVDYYPGGQAGFPRTTEEVIKVTMGANQKDVYDTILGKAPWWVRLKVKAGLPPGNSEIEAMRSFLNGARQVSNTNASFINNPNNEEATKIDKAFRFLQQRLAEDPSYKAVVYSNYINSGLGPYKRRLNKANIPYGEFSGEIIPAVRNQLVKDYNTNKLRALLISSAGSEGLDLKGTRLVQILEPHFNEEKEKQVIGRGVRYHSHEGLPEKKQQVLIQRYLAQPQAGLIARLMGKKTDRGADEYIRDIALRKALLSKQVIDLLNEQNKK